MSNKSYLRYAGLIALMLSLFSCRPKAASYDDEDMRALQGWLDSERTTPAELLAEEITAGRSLVLIQDDVLRADTVTLMRSLVPVIHELGVNSIEVFFLDEADQEDIDRYVVFGDEAIQPEQFLIRANASLGYEEYRDFIEYVRDFNQQGSKENDVVKLLALSRDGSADRNRSLAGAETEVSFLWITADQFDGPPPPSPDGVPPTAILHYGPADEGLRLNGLVETAGARRAIRDGTFAFRPSEVTWAKSDDFAGADIVVVTSFPYRTVEPIADFVTPETVEDAMVFFPNLRLRKPLRIAASRMNGIIRRSARRHERKLDALKNPVD